MSLTLGIAVTPHGAGAEHEASPIFGVKIPSDYRGWPVIAPSYQAKFDEFQVILGNEVATAAYRDGTLPFPDGTLLVKLSWERVPSATFDGAFVPGRVTSVQVMSKDATKYAATGGWGFGKFIDGRPVGAAEHQACFGCHEAHASRRDFVFTRVAP
jgi:hypothetical protein